MIAATFWVGGMLFLSLVAVPVLKQAPDPSSAQRGFVNLARRFRTLVWVALVLLLATGALLLPNQVNFDNSPVSWPAPLLFKILLVALLIGVSLAHDMVVGPKVRRLRQIPPEQQSSVDKFTIKISPVIGRLTTILGLGILLAAILMVRS